MKPTDKTEHEELKSLRLSDQQIRMLRNTGAAHAAIVLYAKTLPDYVAFGTAPVGDDSDTAF